MTMIKKRKCICSHIGDSYIFKLLNNEAVFSLICLSLVLFAVSVYCRIACAAVAVAVDCDVAQSLEWRGNGRRGEKTREESTI